jgi:hypothetical protein
MASVLMELCDAGLVGGDLLLQGGGGGIGLLVGQRQTSDARRAGRHLVLEGLYLAPGRGDRVGAGRLRRVRERAEQDNGDT